MCSGIALLGRIVIGILSIVFALAGLVLAVAGILVKVNSPIVNQLLDTALAQVKAQAASSGLANLDTSKLDINTLVGSLAIVFIVVGCIFLVMGVFGLAGAVCSVKCLLQLYLIIIVLLLIAQVVLVVIIAGERTYITEPIKPTIKDAFKADYAGIAGEDTISLVWNLVMSGLQCCGVDSLEDIRTAPNFMSSSEGMALYAGAAACCKEGQYSGVASTCVTAPVAANSNIYIPCYEKIWDTAFGGLYFIIGALASITFHTLLAIFAYAIIQDISGNKVGAA